MVRLNKIYTRTGDDGTTALGSGERRKKYDLRIAAYGTLDEVNAVIGVARLHTASDAVLDGALLHIQNDLFDLAADPAQMGAHLSQDPALAPLVAARPGLRVPGAWDGFELAIRAICGQQITVPAATRLLGREASWGVEPSALAETMPFVAAHRDPAWLASLAGVLWVENGRLFKPHNKPVHTPPS